MITFDGPVEGRNALGDFLNDRPAPVPDEIRDKLREFAKAPSPVETCVNASELIYARRAELPAELVDIGAAMAVMAAAHGFSGMDRDGRGARMALALRRDAGTKPPKGMTYPKADTDPEPLATFLPAPEELEPVAPEPTE